MTFRSIELGKNGHKYDLCKKLSLIAICGRHHSLFTLRDTDLSLLFETVKPHEVYHAAGSVNPDVPTVPFAFGRFYNPIERIWIPLANSKVRFHQYL